MGGGGWGLHGPAEASTQGGLVVHAVAALFPSSKWPLTPEEHKNYDKKAGGLLVSWLGHCGERERERDSGAGKSSRIPLRLHNPYTLFSHMQGSVFDSCFRIVTRYVQIRFQHHGIK